MSEERSGCAVILALPKETIAVGFFMGLGSQDLIEIQAVARHIK